MGWNVKDILSSLSEDKATSNTTTTVSSGAPQNDLDYTIPSTPDENTLIRFISENSRYSYLDGYASHIIKSATDAHICPLCLIAVSVVNTNGGMFDRWKINNDPGLVQKADVTFDILKPTYAAKEGGGITALANEMKSFSQESGGNWLSYLAQKYVTKAVVGGSDNLVTATEHDLQNIAGTSLSTDNTKIEENRKRWLALVEDTLTELYKNIIGGTPVWTVRETGIAQNPNKATGKPAAAHGSSATGVTSKPGKSHGDHTDTILIKNPQNKTYAEPVYPDLLTVADTVPQWVKTESQIPTTLNTSLFGLDTDTTSDLTSQTVTTKTTESGTTVSIATGGLSNTNNAQSFSTTDAHADVTTGTTQTNSVNKNEQVATPYKKDTSFSSSVSGTSLWDDYKAITGKALNSISSTTTDAVTRQIVYDPSKYIHAFKAPSKGKPANNNDPFPVDLKIEELELHYPHQYIHQLECCPQGVSVGQALLELASASEKRTVKLENNMATLMRYVFALATRIHINCTYWGGTSQFQKYCAIRCLRDDRIEDGQVVSLDQCLSCTRFEPIIGQVYEIINDKGANLAQILDDNQMAYTNMEDYNNFVQTNKYSTKLEDFQVGASTVKIRNSSDKDFKDTWSEGVKMSWNLIPVEEQRPHIGWRQSINDDGSSLQRSKLGSYQYSPANVGAASTKVSSSVWTENKKAMDSNSDATLSQLIAAGKARTNNIQTTINAFGAKDWFKGVKSQVQNGGVKLSPIAFAVLVCEVETEASAIVSKIKAIESALSAGGITNEIITAVCYGISPSDTKGVEYFTGESGSLKALIKNASSSSGDSTQTKPITLKWEKVNDWKWTEFAPYLLRLGISNLDMVPKICYAYDSLSAELNDVKELLEKAMNQFEGQSMPSGTVGCVEAVVRLGQYYSPFLANELANNIAYVPTLLSDAASAGLSIIPFSANSLEIGDILVYPDEAHVVIYSGDGGCYGNSSSQCQVTRYSDYNYAWGNGVSPVQIIKTSQG